MPDSSIGRTGSARRTSIVCVGRRDHGDGALDWLIGIEARLGLVARLRQRLWSETSIQWLRRDHPARAASALALRPARLPWYRLRARRAATGCSQIFSPVGSGRNRHARRSDPRAFAHRSPVRRNWCDVSRHRPSHCAHLRSTCRSRAGRTSNRSRPCADRAGRRTACGAISGERGVHHVHPDRQREHAAEGAAVNFFGLVKAGPDRAGDRRIVAGEERVSEIVGGAGLAGRGEFLQTIFFVGQPSCSFGQRIRQAGSDFVGDLRFQDLLMLAVALVSPDDVAILVFDSVENVRRGGTPAFVRENRVGEGEFRERDLAASEKCRGIGTQLAFHAGRVSERRDGIEPGGGPDANGGRRSSI